jgi:hypothetical protein
VRTDRSLRQRHPPRDDEVAVPDAAGARGREPGAAAAGLGHSSPEITARIYDHTGPEDFREQFERALSFGVGQPFHAVAMESNGALEEKGPGAAAFANEPEGFESGRQDLNLLFQ